ncbi:adenylyltransferase/sulfurtransferase [Saonia flava]|uniref:Molybdopterin-synthase adenylyltransferase n=1 Tax=Saonia flava TaxID=523696 RepID=A0A846QRP4_9FLAO|nr:HesA/MoeB/ThiF family protein [Saonia flava]NJB69867.1 adenylyltransferase/sulfurtransferase [Saonia flava]
MNTKRYIRQTNLKEFGAEGQQKLANASILVIGVGGLGIPVLQYLNAMGVGTIGLVEQDTVELTNLQRQVLYAENDIGRQKLEVALEKLQAQNSGTQFKTFDTFLTRDNALEIIAGFDVVVDASDNFPTRYLVNDACVILKKPFVYGALHGFEGQVSVFNFQGGPTYRCLFPNMPTVKEIPNCNDNGVLGVIPGIIGNLQALEVVKLVTSIGEVLSGILLIYNGLNQSIQKINFNLNTENLSILKLQDTYGNDNCENILNLSADQLQTLISSNTELQLIDVRTPKEYATYSLPGSKNIPLNELEDRYKEIDGILPVYVVCQSGKRSQTAVTLLQKKMNGEFFNVSGGINSYLELFPWL